MKKLLLSAAVVGTMALSGLCAPDAHATEDRITVSSIHSFIEHAEDAINNSNLNVGRHVLDRSIDESAVFENRLATRNAYGWGQNNWYNTVNYNPYTYYNGYHNYYAGYQYPYNTNVNYQSNSKWQKINMFEQKKKSIAGYNVDMHVTNVNLRPYGQSAVADVDIKEYSLTYAPHNQSLVQRVLHANSRCKVYLTQNKDHDLKINRMDCNTNSTLPY